MSTELPEQIAPSISLLAFGGKGMFMKLQLSWLFIQVCNLQLPCQVVYTVGNPKNNNNKCQRNRPEQQNSVKVVYTIFYENFGKTSWGLFNLEFVVPWNPVLSIFAHSPLTFLSKFEGRKKETLKKANPEMSKL